MSPDLINAFAASPYFFASLSFSTGSITSASFSITVSDCACASAPKAQMSAKQDARVIDVTCFFGKTKSPMH
jgi:hypothetical protein